jgi:PAS domain S-box-containing protein
MSEVPLYSVRIIKSFLEYVSRYHSDVDTVPILDYAGITTYQIEDEGHWLTQSQVDRFYEILVKTVGDAGLARKVGQYTPFSKAAGTVSQYTLGFMTPSAAYTVLGKLYPYMSRGSTMQTRSLASNQVEVVAIQNPDVTEKPYQCENRLGVFEGIAKLFTNKLATIEHETCMHASGDRCVYRIRWEETSPLVWKRVAHYSFLVSVVVIPLLLYALPIGVGVLVVLSMLLGVLSIFHYHMHLEKKELMTAFTNHRALADDLLDEINTRYDNAVLVQEVGQAASNILDIEELMEFTIETVKKRLCFGRGLILLANGDATRLVYRAGFGYDPEDETILRSAEFHLDNPKSKGPFVIAYKKQKPFLVNDVSSIEKDISDRSREFSQQLHVESFICVPIVYKGKSEGILVVDNHRLKRPLNQSDVNLFLGIASQIGISINNARSYQRIRENEQRFRALSENAPDIIYTTDVTGAFTYVNPAWQRLLGHSAEEVCSRYFVDFVKPDDRHQYVKLFKEVRDEGRHISGVDGIILHRDGSERLFNISGAPNLDAAGKVIGVVGTFRDVTRQRTLENQLLHASKLEAVGTLTGGIAHDFNNIIQAISGYNQLLMMKKSESDPDWKYLSNIDRLNQRATDLIKQLLIFSRKVDSKLQTMNLNEEVREYYNLLKETIPKMIHVDFTMDPGLWKIKGDPVQLGQVIMNLAVNARDAMPDGGRLRIETMNIDIPAKDSGIDLNPGRYVLLRVSDTGCGMDKETLEHIFEPFYSTKEADKGTGLGLAVVYGIITSHGGRIYCESQPGSGTTFNIHFPALILPDREEPAQTDAAGGVGSVNGTETLLIVDDEEYLLEANRMLLEQSGYRVLTAESGERALEILQKEKSAISLIILDLLMPGMGGIKCLKEMLNIDSRLKIVISSGYITSDKQREVISQGAVDVIHKPYRHQDILTMVRGILDHSAR